MKQLIITIVFTLGSCFCYADFQSLEDIRQTAQRYVEENISSTNTDVEISARNLDRRLKLVQCDTPLESSSNQTKNFTGNISVAIRCNEGHPWMVYVPVSVRVYKTIAVAARPLAQNTLLRSEDIRLKRVDIQRLYGGVVSDLTELTGKLLTRPVQIDQPVLANMVKRPIIVRRGDRVTLLAKSNIVEVRMEGEALMDASYGDRIRVKNLRSRRTIEGKLAENGNTVIVY